MPQSENIVTIGSWVVVRTYSAGCFFGRLVAMDGKAARLEEAIRLWRWEGAFTLSNLATFGVTEPGGCRFAAPVTVTVTEAIEVIEATDQAVASIQSVPTWMG